MLSRIKHTWARYSMGVKGDVVVAALSGGADSVCLLDALYRLREELGITLAAAHLDHGIRGESGRRDAEFARQFAEKLSIDFFHDSADVPAIAKKEGMSIETAARQARYDFFESLPSKFPGVDPSSVKIALGHTADDQAETVLMRLLRGSGVRGLGGIPPVRGRYIRPLIETYRAEIIEYLNSRDLKWVEDETNLSGDYLRNRIRNELMPALIENYNPNLPATLARTANACRDIADMMDEEALEAAQRCKPLNEGVAIPRKLLADDRPARAMALIEAAIMQSRGTLWAVRSDHRRAILEAARSPGNSKITLPGGIEADVGPEWIRLGPPPEEMQDVCEPLILPGITRVDALGVAVEAKFIDGPPSEMPPKTPPEVALFDADSLDDPIWVCNVQPGDRMQPLGMEGSRKIQDLFVDLKIPRHMRRRVPLVTAGDKIVWAAPFRTAHFCRVTEKTKRILRLALLEYPFNSETSE